MKAPEIDGEKLQIGNDGVRRQRWGNSLVNDSVTKLSDSSLNQKNLGVNKKFDLMQNIELKHWHSTDVYVTFKIK